MPIHWSIEDDNRSLWMYTACGLVRVARDDLDAWIADPTHKVETRRWGAADGVPLRAVSPAYSNPPVAKAADGKLWFVSGEGIQVFDPDHLPFNTIPPPVYVEQSHRGPQAIFSRGWPAPAPAGPRRHDRIHRAEPHRCAGHAVPLPAGRP